MRRQHAIIRQIRSLITRLYKLLRGFCVLVFDWLRFNAGLFAEWNGFLTFCLKLAYLWVLSVVLVNVPLPNIWPRYAFWTRKRHHLVSHLNRVADAYHTLTMKKLLSKKWIPLITRQLKHRFYHDRHFERV